MKKILLLIVILISNLSLAQQGIQVTLVNPEIGAPLDSGGIGPVNTQSNDAGLNVILQNYGTTEYIFKGSASPLIQITFDSPNTDQFIADLSAYSAVVAYAYPADRFIIAGSVLTQILNANIGIPTGFNNNIVTTNDVGLNTIFENFNVYAYEQAFPASTWESTLRIYAVGCHCDSELLANALNAYTSVIESTEYAMAFYLANEKFDIKKTAIYPNPFTSTITIDAPGKITSYNLTDSTGKQIIHTGSKTIFDAQTAKLATGAYVLSLQFENGQSGNFKLLKK